MKTTGCGLGGRLRRAWPAIMLLAFAINAPSAYAQDPKPSFVFVDGAAVTLSPDSLDAFKFDILLKNFGAKEGKASLGLVGCGRANMVSPEPMISFHQMRSRLRTLR